MKKTKFKENLSRAIKEIGNGSKIRGITLISLIITIIILIILAGISISMLLGNEGLLNKAKYATESYSNAQQQEEIEIAKYSNEVNSYISGNRNDITEEELWSGLANETKTYNFVNSKINIKDYNYILVLYNANNGSDKQSMLIHKSQISTLGASNSFQLTGYGQRYTLFYFDENSFTVTYTDGTFICISKIIGIK